MLVEVTRRLQLVTPDHDRSAGLADDRLETDRDFGTGPVSWWDKVAERWPNGGRFPSFISIENA